MVNAQLLQEGEHVALILMPNNSASWQQVQVFLLSLALVMVVIALSFAWAGAWLILPFAGLELAAVVISFYYVSLANTTKEVITFSTDEIKIELGRSKVQHSTCFQRAWTRVIITQSTKPLAIPSILLKCKSHSVEIGTFLNSDDKKLLIQHLKKLSNTRGLPVSFYQVA